MKRLKTKKLFYGKYPYRATARVRGVSLIKSWGIAETKQYCDLGVKCRKFDYLKINSDDRVKLSSFIDDIANILNDVSVKTRCEGSNIMFYSLDSTQHQKIVTALSTWITETIEPSSDEEVSKLLEKKNIKLCEKLPGGKYQYRVYLNPSMQLGDRLKAYNWLINYEGRVHISWYTTRWLKGETSWRSSITFDVENDKTLSLIQLYLGKNLIKIEQFIVRSTLINSVSEDNICQQ